MCIDVNVSLPTVNKCLLLYPLRCGSAAILLWTSIRTFLFGIFSILAIPEVLTEREKAFDHYPLSVPNTKMKSGYQEEYYIYLAFISLLMTEAVMFAYAVYNLTVGIYHRKSEPIRQYLVCRFFTWMIELAILFILSLIHGVLIGWYLIMLMIIILEFYGFVIVYSYYRELLDDEAYGRRSKTWGSEDHRECIGTN